MDHSTTLYIIIFLLSTAFIYDRLTKTIPSRLDHNQAPKSAFGIVPVSGVDFPTRADGVDLVFVHGLGSNPDTTWRAKASHSDEAVPDSERFVNWVSDFLPDDLQTTKRNIRTFFYNYDTYWQRDAVETRLQTLGNEFLEELYSKVYKCKAERSRHLIIVAHSHGGLVIKQALVQAQLHSKFDFIVESTKAILFLGTPHRGTTFGKWGWVFAQALRPLGSNPSILADLGYDAFPLRDLHTNFVKATGKDMQIFNFFEKRRTPLFRKWSVQWQQFCVPEQSATYEGKDVRNIGLLADHYGLNKFGSRDASYETIKSKLLEVTENIAKLAKHHYSVPVERVDSYTERLELSRDIDEKMQIRHEKGGVPHAVVLHGLGGTGKSQMALDYAQRHRNRFNPILWLDAENEESLRSSFKRCVLELQLQAERAENQGSIFEDPAVQAVNRWLQNRTEADDQWLVIVDNANNFSWGLKKIIPKGQRGCVIITSQDSLCTQLLNGGCEQARIDVMSPTEAETLFLKHLGLDADTASKEIQHCCNEVVQKLGCLALAIDLAGAYIGIGAAPQDALPQYLTDYDRHHSELLKMDDFRGLLPTEKTVWTVWDATLEKIRKEHTSVRPDFLLTLLAHFKGNIVQEEMFRLASIFMENLDFETAGPDVEISVQFRQFFSTKNGERDSFYYRKGRDVLLRYNLLQQVEGNERMEWPGVTMHNLVRWRAKQDDKGRHLHWGYHRVFLIAACCQLIEEGGNEFRRHLIVHAQDMDVDFSLESQTSWMMEDLATKSLGQIYLDEGRWKEAEKLYVRAVKMCKTVFGEEHPHTLTCVANLGTTILRQGRWREAGDIYLQVLKACNSVIGEEHPLTLGVMNSLALALAEQGQWKEAEQLLVRDVEASKKVLGENHPDTLMSINNLATLLVKRGRRKEAQELHVQVGEMRKRVLGEDHPDTLSSVRKLALMLHEQNRWKEAGVLQAQVLAGRRRVLGTDHPDTLISMYDTAHTHKSQGRWEDAIELMQDCMHRMEKVLGVEHQGTESARSDLTTWRFLRQMEAQCGCGLWKNDQLAGDCIVTVIRVPNTQCKHLCMRQD